MSEPQTVVPPPSGGDIPPLRDGERLDQKTFHERYEAMPRGTRAELIDGVVFLHRPVGPPHGRATKLARAWLYHYQENTPGVESLDDVSTDLGPKSEVQPDAMLRILTECGGKTVTDRNYVHGEPELVVEVSHATRSIDLGVKLRDYERAGVLEYLVRTIEPDEVIWHVRREGRLVRVPADPDGLYRSRVFPGLWLDSAALVRGDMPAILRVLDQGIASPEHAAFAAELERAFRQGGV